jgi:flagellar hook assembly protein FlgD
VGDFGINEVLFSPDNDGFQDIASFYYTLNEPGYIATATIYNDEGTIIKTLFANELLGAEGSFYWDGSTNNQQKAAIGIYFCVLDAFQLDGSRNYVKRIAFTLAGKIN